MELVKSVNLIVRFILELCALTALGYWGFHVGNGMLVKFLLGIGAPLMAALIWGAFVAPHAAYKTTGPLHFLIELLVMGSAALALYFSKKYGLCYTFTSIYVINRFLLTVWQQ